MMEGVFFLYAKLEGKHQDFWLHPRRTFVSGKGVVSLTCPRPTLSLQRARVPSPSCELSASTLLP